MLKPLPDVIYLLDFHSSLIKDPKEKLPMFTFLDNPIIYAVCTIFILLTEYTAYG